jgi:cytochrome P450
MMQWLINPFAFMETCAQRYGDIFTVPLGPNFRSIVFISNPQALQKIFTSDTKQVDAPGQEAFGPLLGKHGLLTVSGDRHQRQRQLLMPPFHGERMRVYDQLLCELTEQVTSQWTIGKPFSVRASMQVLSLRIILRVVFGLVEGLRYQQLEQLLTLVLDEISSPVSVSLFFFPVLQKDLGPLSPWGSFLRRQEQIDQLIYTEIQERREQPNPSGTDILTLLMSARDEAGEPMTDVELRDELLTLLVTGHEATATALTWAFYWIHKLPSVREQLLQELDSLGDKPDKNAISRLPYLNAVCRETLRIYPGGMVTLPRVVKAPLSLMGYQLEPGTILLGCIYLIHHREDLYPEPHSFKPERFLERQFSPYEYLPFGGGSRGCIGMAFSQFEMKVILANILSRFELALADNRPVRPVRRGTNSAPSDMQLVVTG